MSLRLIYGKAGTGKSDYILKEVKDKLNKNSSQKIYIIVPEQFSYATEKKLLETLDENASINAEIISFKRLAYRVSLEVGGSKRIILSKIGRTMLAKYILEQNKKNLNFLGKTSDVDLILRTITELKKHNITNTMIEEQIEKTDNEYLKLKLNDINKIYTEYEQTIANNYIDEDDTLTILGKDIEKSKIFNDSIVYIDEFAGFTEQEYVIIEEILKKAKQVNITICTDKLNKDEEIENDIFYPNKTVVEKLRKHLQNTNASEEKPVYLSDLLRFKNDELKFLGENLYSIKYKIYNKEVEHIHLQISSNPYAEIESVADTIINLVREKDIRFRDISILTKNIDDYIGVVSAIFPKYNIPVFIDNKKELSDSILVKYILAMFDVLAKNWSEEAIWSYIKTGFLDIEKSDIYKLENYCKKWGIKRSKWYKEDWTYDSDIKDIEYLNELRKKIVEPLITFKKKLDGKKTAKEITIRFYEFLEENNIKEKLEEKIKSLELQEETKYANEYASSYNILMEVLDEISLVFEKQIMTFEEYRNILKSGLEASSIGEIPESIDQIIIGDIERSRNHKVHTLFILGVNDGTFPNNNFSEGFLNDNDRNYLKEQGIELAKGTLDNIYEDRFNIYKAFTTSENDIYLSYISSDKEGKAKRPSVLIARIKNIFPKLKEESSVVKKEINISTPNATFGKLLTNIRNIKNGEEVDDIWKVVYKWYIDQAKWRGKIKNSIKYYENKNKPDKISKENIKRLYGETLKTSVSRLEQYRKCPFSFHLKYGLKLKEKEDLRIKPIDTGSFMHDIIDTFFESVKDIKSINEEQIEEIVINIINEKLYLSKNYIFTSTPKFIVLTNRLKKVVTQSIKYIVYQVQNSDFNILANELEFRRKIDNIEITGKIDRIDSLDTKERKIY